MPAQRHSQGPNYQGQRYPLRFEDAPKPRAAESAVSNDLRNVITTQAANNGEILPQVPLQIAAFKKG